MSPLEYVRAARRRWLVVVVALAVGLGAGWGLSQRLSQSQSASRVRTHVASAVILSSEGRAGIGNLNTMAALVNVGEVPERVAEKLGVKDPVALASRIQVVGEAGTGLLTITATSTDPDEARLIANTFAKEILAYADEEQAREREVQLSRLEQARTAALAEIARLTQELGTASAEEAAALGSEIRQRQSQAQLFIVQKDQVALTYRDSGAQLIQPAQAVPSALSSTEKPTSPSLLLMVCAVLGLAGGIALVLVLERFDTKIRTKARAESYLGLPVITEIPLLRRRQRHAAGRVTALLPRSLAADAYRLLAAALSTGSDAMAVPASRRSESPLWDSFSDTTVTSSRHRDDVILRARPVVGSEDDSSRDLEEDSARFFPAPSARVPGLRGNQVILVASPAPGDGKTSAAINLATCFAEIGKQTLLLSCDFHRPSLHAVLGVPNDKGLAEALAGFGSPVLDGCVVRTTVEDLEIDVVPTGMIPERPAELMSSSRMRRVLSEARNAADVVIIDTAPLLSASDAAALLPHVDTVVVVARAGKTTLAQAEETTELLKRLGAPPSVAVLNGVKEFTIWSRTKRSFRPHRRRRTASRKALAET